MYNLKKDSSGKTFTLTFIHPETGATVFDGDGFRDKEDAASFVADIYAAVTDAVLPDADIMEKLKEV